MRLCPDCRDLPTDDEVPNTLHLAPYTLHPTPYTLHPTPYTLHPTPYTLLPTPYALHPTPYNLHPSPYTLHQPGKGGALRVFTMNKRVEREPCRQTRADSTIVPRKFIKCDDRGQASRVEQSLFQSQKHRLSGCSETFSSSLLLSSLELSDTQVYEP